MAGSSRTRCTRRGWFERGGGGGSGAAVWQPLLAGKAALPPDVGAALVRLLDWPEVAQLRLCCKASNALVRGSLTRVQVRPDSPRVPTRAMVAGLLDAFPAVTELTVRHWEIYPGKDYCVHAPYGGAAATLRQLTLLRVPAASSDLLRACSMLTSLGLQTLAAGIDSSDEGSVQQYGAALVGLRHLRKLEVLSFAVLAPLLEGLRSWTGLTGLGVSVNMVANPGSELLCGICACTSVQHLSLIVNTPLNSVELRFPRAVNQLRELHLSNVTGANPPVPLHLGLAEFSQLTLLRLHGCESLEGPPAALGSLTLLKELELVSCPGEALPSGVWSHLTGLEVLRLRFWPRLRFLPEDLGRLQRLRELELQGCIGLIELPSSIAQWGALQALSISDCTKLFQPSAADDSESEQIDTDVESNGEGSVYSHPYDDSEGSVDSHPYDGSNEEASDGVDCSGEHSLEGNTSDAAAPETAAAAEECAMSCLWQLTQLTHLRFEDCKLTALPAGLGRLRNLKELDLSSNDELMALPDDIERLTGLTKLNLQQCEKLSMLPTSLSQLTRLQVLNLWSCDSLTLLPPLHLGHVPVLDLRRAGHNIRESLNFLTEPLNVL